ncbi:hypothetical protein F5146DRAFT_1217808 [Armillaria mellea]|nr:hypothetical protein F5146DRAFT_1217808 [Armillaria mellea]
MALAAVLLFAGQANAIAANPATIILSDIPAPSRTLKAPAETITVACSFVSPTNAVASPNMTES